MKVKAIIADDEQPLRQHLKSKLERLWPELEIVGEATNGIEAQEFIETLKPDIAFLDIQMPGQTGLDVAAKTLKLCRIVFITAYDQYAIKAFENETVDYLLKPLTDDRLYKTISRLKDQIGNSSKFSTNIAEAVERALTTMERNTTSDYLRWIRAQVGDEIQLISTADIIFFRSEDKYTVVVTKDNEFIIRKTIKTLTEELDPEQFWQVHRGTIVNVDQISRVSRSFSSQLSLRLKNTKTVLAVSRSYTHLFKQM
jgi:DNA-binding LytR/AlgR family response regulator